MENNNEAYSTMYLKCLPQPKRHYLNKNSSLDVSDIQGARSTFLQKPRHPREVFNNRNDDIEKSRSRVIIPKQTNKPDRQLEVDDIAGTRTKVNKFVSTRRTDPLNPQYQLPEVLLLPPEVPKFIRDNLELDDIEGTRTKQSFVLKVQRSGKFIEKQPLKEERKTFQPRKDNYLGMDVTDINNKQKKIKGERCTNPLNPVYTMPSSNEPCWQRTQGFIEGSAPRNPKQNIVCPDYSLMTKDISGAVTRVIKGIESSKKQACEGSQVNTLKRGISSNRSTNPLAPKYAYPGHSEARGYSRPKTAVQRFDEFIS